jgi:hypothetical protein
VLKGGEGGWQQKLSQSNAGRILLDQVVHRPMGIYPAFRFGEKGGLQGGLHSTPEFHPACQEALTGSTTAYPDVLPHMRKRAIQRLQFQRSSILSPPRLLACIPLSQSCLWGFELQFQTLVLKSQRRRTGQGKCRKLMRHMLGGGHGNKSKHLATRWDANCGRHYPRFSRYLLDIITTSSPLCPEHTSSHHIGGTFH